MTHSRTFRVVAITALLLLPAAIFALRWDRGKKSVRSDSDRPVEAVVQDLRAAIATLDAANELVGTADYVQAHDAALFSSLPHLRELSKMGPHAASAIPILLEILDGPERRDSTMDTSLHAAACDALGQIGLRLIPELIEELKSSDPSKRQAAARTLGQAATLDRQVVHAAVQPLAETVADEDRSVRLAAIEALSHFGRKARGAASALTRALEDDDKQVREYAAYALRVLDPEAAAQAKGK